MADEQDTPTPEDQSPQEDTSEVENEESAVDSTDAADASDDTEAAALAAAMAAINQVQGVADSAAPAEPAASTATDAQPFAAPEFGAEASDGPKGAIDLLSDVHMDVRIELGRTNMYVEDVLRLNEGAVVELDKLAGDPVDVFVNDRRVAKGEVLVLNDMFCVRINEVVDITQADSKD